MDRKEHQLRDEILDALRPLESHAGQDPFLASCYWEKIHVQYNLQAAYGDATLQSIYAGSLGAVQQAIRQGYPAAHLYNELGVLLELGQRPTEAREAYLKATQAPLDVTPARQNLLKIH